MAKYGLTNLYPTFLRHKIVIDDLWTLTDKELTDMDFTVGEKRQYIKAAKKAKEKSGSILSLKFLS